MRKYLQMRWIGLMSKPGSSPLTLIIWFITYLEMFVSQRHCPGNQVVRVMGWEWQTVGTGTTQTEHKRVKAYCEVLFVGEQEFCSIRVVGAVGFVHDELVFL